MILFLLASLVPSFSSAEILMGSLDCKAIYKNVEYINNKEKHIEEEAPLKVVFAAGSHVKYEVSLGGKYFSVDEDKVANSLLAFITTAPEYTKGSVTRGNTDNNGVFNFSTVDGFMVHRLECRRQPETNPSRLGL